MSLHEYQFEFIIPFSEVELTTYIRQTLPNTDSVVFTDPDSLTVRFTVALIDPTEVAILQNLVDTYYLGILNITGGGEGDPNRTFDSVLITDDTEANEAFTEACLITNGGILVNKSIRVKGSATIGNEAVDTLDVNATLVSDLIPTHNLYDLGTSSQRWKNAYIQGNIVVSGNVDGRDISIDGTTLDNHILNTNNPHATTIDHVTPTTTKGDLIVETGSNAIRLPVGVDGQILTADSTLLRGVKWADNNFINPELQSVFFDDFMGAEFLPLWNITVSNDSTICLSDSVGGVIKLTSGNPINSTALLSTKNKTYSLGSYCKLKIRAKLSSITNNKVKISLLDTTADLCEFEFDSSINANWIVRTKSSGTATSVTSSVVADTDWHIFNIVCTPTSVVFKVDGQVLATNTTNLPVSGALLKLDILQQTIVVSSGNILSVDYVSSINDRPGSSPNSGFNVNDACSIM